MKAVTSTQMREIDERAEKEFGVKSLDLMENAGRAVANKIVEILSQVLRSPLAESSVVVCCGRGNNGGDGMVAARYLKKLGVGVEVFYVPPSPRKEMKKELQIQIEKAKKDGLTPGAVENPEALVPALSQTTLILDALLGTGAKGKPMGPIHHVIQKMMKAAKPIAALDIPSGIDADTGYHSGVYIQAKWTLTLGLPKVGLLKPHAQQYVGELVVLDIGHPPELLKKYAA
ncbi:MAG: NAD(P)H-hydrate epimerase [Elusimicrobia bacterium]|nr:NAD(P)H-hydrate epimerase [Elusimicrobiota bacterium]